VTGQRFPNRPKHSSSRYVVNLMRDDRLRLEAIVADRSAPQNMYGAPSTFSPRPPVAAPPRSCAAASNRAGSKAMAGAIMPRVSWADARQEAHCRQEAAASPPFSGSSIWRLGCRRGPAEFGNAADGQNVAIEYHLAGDRLYRGRSGQSSGESDRGVDSRSRVDGIEMLQRPASGVCSHPVMVPVRLGF
jgi:hypothetical protein